MRVRALLVVGGIIGAIGVVLGFAVESASGADESSTAVFMVAGLSIVVLLAAIGFAAGWFGRERDDVVVTSVGAGIAVAVALAIASIWVDDVAMALVASVVSAFAVAVGGGVAGAATWWIGDLICDGRDLPTARRLIAPAYADDYPGSPLWTTDAGPAIRTTLDRLADSVAPGDPVDGRAVGIVLGLPRDLPVVMVLAGGQLAIQPVDINGTVNGDPSILHQADIAEVSFRSLKADGTARRINAYDDVITIRSAHASDTRLRLPYGTRGVGTTTGGPDVIREWLKARSGIDRRPQSA